MIAELADAALPASLMPFCAAMSAGGTPERRSSATDLDAALDSFASAHERAPRDALVSLWSMYYLSALIIPATAALLMRDRILPVALGDIAMVCDESNLPRFVLDAEGRPGIANRRFATLVEGHLMPFVAFCTRRSGASPRVFWSNAAVTLDWALGEIDPGAAVPAARREAVALLDGSDGLCRMASPLRSHADGTRTRRVCCLRYRVPGIDDCGGLCPRAR